MTEKSIFTTGEKYELAELTMHHMVYAYKHGVIPPQFLIDMAYATWTDDYLFGECPELKPEETVKNESVREFIKQECPDLSEKEIDEYLDEEMTYRYDIEPRREYVRRMYRTKHGIGIIKVLHPEWEDSIDAYMDYADAD